MKKLTALLVAAMFSLTAAVPVSAAPADNSLEMVPAAADNSVAKVPTTKVVKSAKKHKQIKKAKHKRAKARTHKRLRRH